MFYPEEFAMSDEEQEEAAHVGLAIIGSTLQVGLMALNDDSKYRDYFCDHFGGIDDQLLGEIVMPVLDEVIQGFLTIDHSDEGTKEMTEITKLILGKIFGNGDES